MLHPLRLLRLVTGTQAQRQAFELENTIMV